MSRVKPITSTDFDRINGKIFVCHEYQSVEACQIVGYTKSSVKVRHIQMIETPNSLRHKKYTIDWKWVSQNPYVKRDKSKRMKLKKSGTHYYLQTRKVVRTFNEVNKDSEFEMSH